MEFVPGVARTAGRASMTSTFFAVPEDNLGAVSDPFLTSDQVM
jgi:hypothetical protein